MTVVYRALWFATGALILISTSSNSMEYKTPLMFIYNVFTKDVAVMKHTIHSVEVTSAVECFRHCARVCGCLAFQVTRASCELLDNADGDLVARQGTLLYIMQQNDVEGNGSCLNGCCESRPCLNGGTCRETCGNIKEQYACACSEHYYGKRCELFNPAVKSCQSIARIKPGVVSGIYDLVISFNKTIRTYCDFSSEAGKAWTLIESFSLGNKEFYKNKPFYHDFPRNENNFTWDDFRVSYQALVTIRDNSTHWRVTCSFPSGLTYSDYARASLTATDLLTFANQDKCRQYEYVSVRGINCTDCKGMQVQRDYQHMHTDSYWSGKNSCEWDPRAGAVMHEDNFGFYDVTNPQHKCTKNSLSTTQWWLGAEL
ncbi:uncharacterized protein [Montipora foliosa]|uniref:uncharacterized protein n=1 Tax=Montipora foliosa TaxID=591990 RepID=UPI0035F1FD2B